MKITSLKAWVITRTVRELVYAAGEYALERAIDVKIKGPHVWAAARALDKHVKNINKLLESMPHFALDEVAECFAPYDHNDDDDTAKKAIILAAENIDEMMRAARSLKERIERLQKNTPLCTPSRNRNVDPLSFYYILMLAKTYVLLTRKPVPRGRNGPFPRLLAAGWRDLNLPIQKPARRDPEELREWLGTLVEKHPWVLSARE